MNPDKQLWEAIVAWPQLVVLELGMAVKFKKPTMALAPIVALVAGYSVLRGQLNPGELEVVAGAATSIAVAYLLTGAVLVGVMKAEGEGF